MRLTWTQLRKLNCNFIVCLKENLWLRSMWQSIRIGNCMWSCWVGLATYLIDGCSHSPDCRFEWRLIYYDWRPVDTICITAKSCILFTSDGQRFSFYHHKQERPIARLYIHMNQYICGPHHTWTLTCREGRGLAIALR